MPRQLKILPQKCIGCKSCELACSLANHNELNPSRSRITVIGFLEGKFPLPYNIPFTCKQCADALCLHACPVGAISFLRNTMKTVAIDYDTCIKCGKCISACPFGAMLFDVEIRRPFKCELCGGDPACASICPTEAIAFVPQKPYYSKEQALRMDGCSILSQRQQESVRSLKSKK